ncbi:MAG TPA: hypothetical protein VL442_23290, partial [Mucilaginibacter sp.]|nr:hypothetical protein [Mucilaginibacter sp.]
AKVILLTPKTTAAIATKEKILVFMIFNILIVNLFVSKYTHKTITKKIRYSKKAPISCTAGFSR